MKACPYCKEQENGDDERFCTSCGADMDGAGAGGGTATQATAKRTTDDRTGAVSDESTKIINDNSPGRLVLNGKTLTTVDSSQRLVGRADLRAHTKEDPDRISRSHFTVYRKEFMYMIKDGVTSVQDRPSAHGTLLNGEKLTGAVQLIDGDTITVSDMEITFEV